MAHEINEHDNVVLAKRGAWHGLGTVVQDAPTPHEALRLGGLDWTVDQLPLAAKLETIGESTGISSMSELAIDSHVLNVRSDTKTQLGIVGTGYVPFQNSELADFAYSLAEQGDIVKVETAGSIQNGRKVWFLLQGESFTVRKEDEVRPYILLSNGHNGAAAFRCTPTTIRVVCSNTLHMVIPRSDSEGRATSLRQAGSFVAIHSGNLADKIEEAKATLGLYGKSLDSTREVIDSLAAKDVNHEMVQKFFLECYVRDFGAIPANPTTRSEEGKRKRALESYEKFGTRFDSEKAIAGATVWNAFNSYTGWLQNDRAVRIKDDDRRREQKTSSVLFGTNADRTTASLSAALNLVS